MDKVKVNYKKKYHEVIAAHNKAVNENEKLKVGKLNIAKKIIQ